MRSTLFTALTALSSLLAVPAPAQAACRPTQQAYHALYRQGVELEARAAATSQGPERVNAYLQAANTFEQALCVRDRQGIADNRIYTALGTVYLGAGNLVLADVHLRRGLANAGSLARADQGRLYTAVGYLNALRGDNVEARRYYQRGADFDNPSARQSLMALRSRRAR